jgi:O-antigen/teichoic acid export membrane protein
MSRFNNAARSLTSGYMAMGANVLYTLVSVPLALHFLSKEEFGLWALAGQATGYLVLIDFGIAGAVSRILIDHKDQPADGKYGSVLKTSCLVLAIQGVLVVIGGCALALFLPALMNVPAEYVRACQLLIAAQCTMIGVAFPGRILTSLLQAHQRYDAINFSQIGQLATGLTVQWITFYLHMGVYSLLAASCAFWMFGLISNFIWVKKLRLFPSRGAWGRANRKTFKEVFAFGGELFLLLLGSQLLNASQIIVITRSLGLSAAAVWTVATKVYPLAFQLVSRIFDFSSSAFGEMVVRGEQEGLRRRFRDVFLLTASAAVFVGAGVAVCNGSFLEVWTRGKIVWGIQNDVLLGSLLIVSCITRCHVGLLGPLKNIGGMRYIYFAEGLTFVVAGFVIAPHWGITGVLIVAVLADALLTGVYGFWRTADHFGTSVHEVLFGWLRSAWIYLGLMALISAAVWWSTLGLPPLARLITQIGVLGLTGLSLLWRAGLDSELRVELRARVMPLTPAWVRRAGAALGI